VVRSTLNEVTERRPPGRTIAVEEVRLDATDVDAAAAPADLRHAGGRRRRASLLVAAVVGALAAGATTITVIDPGGDADDAATAPSTTAPPPIRASAGDERRVMLREPPAGFELTDVREVHSGQVQPPATATLYARLRPSATEGEWVLAVLSPPASRLPLDVGFRRPSRTASLGATAGAVGWGSFGDETTAFDDAQGRVALTARGLEPGLTEVLARRVRIERGVVQLAAADLPAGLVEHAVWRLPPGLAFGRGLGGHAGEADGWHASYRAGDGGAIDVAASQIAPAEVGTVASISRFLLADAGTASVRGHAAVVGRSGRSIWVVWTEGATLVTVSISGVEPAAAVQVAAMVRLGSDGDWDEPAWPPTGQLVGGDLIGRIVGRGGLSGATSWWDVTAVIDGSEVVWALRTGHNAAAAVEQRTPISSPLTLIASGQQMYTRDPIGADAGELSDWYAVALAVGDPGLAGARLRLTTDGPVPATSEAALHAVRGVEGHVVAALVLPWTDHYTVEVVAADGEVLASATDLS
jgi:hypothetical protein